MRAWETVVNGLEDRLPFRKDSQPLFHSRGAPSTGVGSENR